MVLRNKAPRKRKHQEGYHAPGNYPKQSPIKEYRDPFAIPSSFYIDWEDVDPEQVDWQSISPFDIESNKHRMLKG